MRWIAMKYISKGIVVNGSTEQILHVTRCGVDFQLTGEQAAYGSMDVLPLPSAKWKPAFACGAGTAAQAGAG